MSFRSYDLLTLVRDFGEPLTLRKLTTDGTYNPATGSVSGSATTDYDFTGYFYNYEVTSVDQIRKGTRKCVIPALAFVVEPDDEDLIVINPLSGWFLAGGTWNAEGEWLDNADWDATGDSLTFSTTDKVTVKSVTTIFSDGSPVCYLCHVEE